MRTEHSRGVHLAAGATGESESQLERRLADASIAVSVDPRSILASLAGRRSCSQASTRSERHDAQGLWPDRLIDAATGDTVVGLQDIVPDGPCLRCLIPAPIAEESAAHAVAQELGLPVALVMRG
ncbi:MAG TPA: hypothetical protein VG244_15435 [Acidimicrobiales bacterium]|jgi:hypothetical protein|nr:hypothetical protein [Acidimicrobiales bacterium]